MTEEDYMKLPKKRLAQLLAERDSTKDILPYLIHPPERPMCYEPGGFCTNPQRDCINCPKISTGGSWTTNTNIYKNE